MGNFKASLDELIYHGYVYVKRLSTPLSQGIELAILITGLITSLLRNIPQTSPRVLIVTPHFSPPFTGRDFPAPVFYPYPQQPPPGH
jgi:hypothetical protein